MSILPRREARATSRAGPTAMGELPGSRPPPRRQPRATAGTKAVGRTDFRDPGRRGAAAGNPLPSRCRAGLASLLPARSPVALLQVDRDSGASQRFRA